VGVLDFIKLFLPSKKLPAHEKFAVQFHQQLELLILSLNWHTFCQTLFDVCPICVPKKALHPVCNMFMKLTPGLSPYFFRKLCYDFQQLATLQSSLILKVQQEVLSSDILMEANVQLHSIQI